MPLRCSVSARPAPLVQLRRVPQFFGSAAVLFDGLGPANGQVGIGVVYDAVVGGCAGRVVIGKMIVDDLLQM